MALMARSTPPPKNIIFWGAGATQALGIRTTACQQHFIRCITGSHGPRKSLRERIKEALGPGITQPWHDALVDLITILGDSEESYDSISEINSEQLTVMRRNWRKGAPKK